MGCAYTERDLLQKLAHMIMEVSKFQDLLGELASWRLYRVNGVVPKKLKSLRARPCRREGELFMGSQLSRKMIRTLHRQTPRLSEIVESVLNYTAFLQTLVLGN